MAYETSGTAKTTRQSPTDEKITVDNWDNPTLQNLVNDNGTLRLAETATIPDSAIYRWAYGSGSGSTATDSIGNADGTINGATWNSGTWIKDYALDGNGTDSYVSTTGLGDFGTTVMNGSHAIAFTMKSSDITSSSSLFGTSNSSGRPSFWIDSGQSGTGGNIEVFNRGASSGGVRLATDNTFDDGNPHRVVINYSSQSASGIDIYVDTNSETFTTVTDDHDGTFEDFANPFLHFARYNGGAEAFANVTLDDIIIFNDTLNSTQRQDDYDRQPWS
ncbi:hypothetical protein Htur_5021 (plasmid) [Haloterrigena turkmenica DSM 5511]|uniref:Uncharacterized protein n=1 Tax=Haloterrigena turkmenica (strain ATCC 51198 / DSM 5511 / JCM 9101 / NCIMB 13204 / VKM B-1734 / 4k) TaxID=543526 RepID=D2S3G2_HALTV|nr:hypothetical protein [Haloterrigena turkmenica]ADB63909.1 hypothetical protein Htur_5021 [Haloterrigena turkmenica DSM 5511]